MAEPAAAPVAAPTSPPQAAVPATAVRPRSRALRVSRVVQETADAHSLVFEVPAEDREMFRYRPGQFLTLRIPSERTGSVARCYSLASSPHGADPGLTVTVKRTAGGYGSNWLCDNVRAGTELEVLAPAGLFTPADLDVDLFLAAGGSGVTPVLSILRSALAAGTGRVAVLYANRDESSVIFAAELRRLAAAHPERLTVLHWLESVQGVPTVPQLSALVGSYADREAFVCGPGPFMDAVSAALRSAGADPHRVHVEVFTSLEADPFAEIVVPRAVEGEESEAVQVVVELDGDTHELAWPAGVRLVDLLLSKGIDAPYSCRDGVCGACQAQVLKGRVRMESNDVLDDDDLAEGHVLGCQSVPDPETPGAGIHVRF
ncbi:ferredoxin--NADP reductase [Pseudonocardia pini]|uniref:ferredoxin--NADP reductase n=1 Tax=Pseudonocardia pini TaxID=2758030 RepID=UPI0015F0298C|nr:ferredoxin--NADP reductase [Pseudonocardia pini]